MSRCDWMRAWLAAGILITATVFSYPTAAASVPGACTEDADKLCAETADREKVPCLKQHEEQLSTPCQNNLTEAPETAGDLEHACQSDIQKFCADIKPSDGRTQRCLRHHRSELSPGCRRAMAQVKKKF